MCTKRPTPASLRGEDEAAGALGHDPLELLFLSLSDRDQVDDALDALDRAFQGGGLGHVALHELAAQRLEALGRDGGRGRGTARACRPGAAPARRGRPRIPFRR